MIISVEQFVLSLSLMGEISRQGLTIGKPVKVKRDGSFAPHTDTCLSYALDLPRVTSCYLVDSSSILL